MNKILTQYECARLRSLECALAQAAGAGGRCSRFVKMPERSPTNSPTRVRVMFGKYDGKPGQGFRLRVVDVFNLIVRERHARRVLSGKPNTGALARAHHLIRRHLQELCEDFLLQSAKAIIRDVPTTSLQRR